MTDTCPAPAPSADWRVYAAEIREAVLLKEAARASRKSASQPDDDRADALVTVPDATPLPLPSLSLRQELLILGLAATLGSRQRLSAELDRGAITILTGLRSELIRDLARLLQLALPEGFCIAKGERDRQQPGTVTVIAPESSLNLRGREELQRNLTAALSSRALVILVLPDEAEVHEILGRQHPPVLPFRLLEGEIIAELLARLHPGTEAAVLREQLPADDQLKEVSMLSLMLALRADSAEGAITLLQQPHRQPTPLQVLEERWGGKRTTPVRPEPGAIPLAELAGLDEARDIAVGITEDLRSWAAGTLDWHDVHRGLLIAGPPGCGKTELARAMAREPGIHLEAGSYATWQAAGHLGLMLEAMRESFRRAAAQAPSVLFIDEIDSFGSRVGGRTSRNESYEEKVIGGLLELLDGIGGRQGVVVIGACNHPERIDPAIRRAGRFDDLVHIARPGSAALATILRQQLGNDLAEVDLTHLGQMAVGRSGADCAAAVRTARAKARRARRQLEERDLRDALGPDHQALPLPMRRRAALHEAGHAIIIAVLGLGIVKALRIGAEGGETITRWHPTEQTAAQAHRQCMAHLGGRAAELLMLGDASAGAGGDPEADLARATRLLLACELSLGLGDHGHLSIGADPDLRLLLSLPSATRARLQRRLDRAMEDAQDILCQHHALLEKLAHDLETRGFIGEAELAFRLGPWRRSTFDASGLAS